jgi:hypothetical protein
MGSVVECDVFGVARRVCDRLLFRQRPQDYTRSQVVSVTLDGVAGVRTVHKIRVGVSNKV